MDTSAQRIRHLRLHYNLSVKEFAARCGLSHVAIFHLESGKTAKPHKNSLFRIASAFGTTVDWILQGKSEMLPHGRKELDNELGNEQFFWKNEAYLELKSKNQMLEKEVDRLWQMVHHLSGSVKPGYERVLDAG